MPSTVLPRLNEGAVITVYSVVAYTYAVARVEWQSRLGLMKKGMTTLNTSSSCIHASVIDAYVYVLSELETDS